MGNEQGRYQDDQKARHHYDQTDTEIRHRHDGLFAGEERSGYLRSLLGHAGLGGRGNASTRSAVMQRAQQAHGNRVVQRLMQRSASALPGAGVDDGIAQRIESRSGAGSGLDLHTRDRLEESLGVDLSGLRVHTDAEADKLARSVSAVAFTSGRDIFFREGAYNPHSSEGLRLLAHETTHTVQQAAGPVAGTPAKGGISVSDPSDEFEQEAERAADAVMSGNVAGQGASSAGLSVGEGSEHAGADTAVQRYPDSNSDFFPGYNPTPDIPLPFHPMPGGGTGFGWQPPGRGQEPGPWAYYKGNDKSGLDMGVEGGFGAFHGEGDILGLPAVDDLLYGHGKLGAWDNGKGQMRHGAEGDVGVAKWTINNGGAIQGDAEALTANAEASIGDDGATLGAQATAVGGSMTFNSGDEMARVGLSEGIGMAGRLHWGLNPNGDGNRMYGFGADFGPFSFDVKSEDPLRTLARTATGGMSDWALPTGNVTNQAGQAASDAWDTAQKYGDDIGKYAVNAYDTASSDVNGAVNAVSDFANGTADTVSGYASQAGSMASDLWDSAASW